MDEINETDEVINDNEAQVKDPHLKEAKLKKLHNKEDKYHFDSGDYYKQLDFDNKMM